MSTVQPSATHGPAQLLLCLASDADGSTFRVCGNEDEAMAFYKEMWGEDLGGGIQSQIDHFRDEDNWSHGMTEYHCELYCSNFRVWRVDRSEISTPSEIAPNDVGQMLLDVARCASYALEDSEETGEGHIITNEHAVDLQAALDALETLPPEPGYANSGPNNAAYALKRTVSATREKLTVETFDGEEPAVPCGISWIIRHHDGIADFACAQCVPDGENLIEGFVCYYHAALALKESQ